MRLLIVGFGLLALLSACGEEKKAEKKENLLPVVVEKVVMTQSQQSKRFSATIRPRLESDLSFRVGGKLAKRHVDLGQNVKAGQELLSLDTTAYQLQLEQAQAEMKASEISFKQMQDELARQKDLLDKGYVPMSAFDKQRAAVGEAEARLERTKRLVELAQNDFSYTILRAEADGVVTALLAEQGQVIGVGQGIIRVAQANDFEALIAVPEADLDFVKKADGKLTLWADGTKTYLLALRELSSSADPLTRTYSARFGLTNPDEHLRFGLSAEAVLSVGDAKSEAILPLTAIFNQGGKSSVWVIEGENGVKLTPVALGSSDGKSVKVLSGLKEGDGVVAMGVHKLDAQTKVKVVAPYGS